MSHQTKITQRQFLLMGGTVGATILACGGLTALGIHQPEIKFIEENYGDMTSGKSKILVTYASKCGSTGEVAKSIGDTLANTGATVDVRPINDVSDPSAYRAVIVGSAIRAGRWLPEASAFVKTHQQTLSQISTAYFTVCMTLSQDTEENRRKVIAFLDPVRQIVKPVAEGFFAGKMDYDKLSFVDRLVLRHALAIHPGELVASWAAERNKVTR